VKYFMSVTAAAANREDVEGEVEGEADRIDI
jgi:hypothetical protein